MHLAPSKMKQNLYFNIFLIWTHGPWTHITLWFLLKNHWKAVPSRSYHLQITVKSVYIFILGLKYAAIRPENTFWKFEVSKKSTWQPWHLLLGIAQSQWNLLHISFSDYSGKIMTFLWDYDVIIRRFPRNSGIPHDFVTIVCHNSRYNTLWHPNLK